MTWAVGPRGPATLTDRYGTVQTFERVLPAKPAVTDLQALTGVYVSEDAETTFTVTVEGGSLTLKRRPDTTIRLTPLYKDAFSGQLGTVVFRPSASPLQFSVVQDRVWDMRFTRREGAQATARD
jgi:hypothetical protein